ncbi:MAG: hypothetical protein HQL61_07410 [Magnetococcales bacterium]|nr:hypothetical protein [Nitrospirota bacterium]
MCIDWDTYKSVNELNLKKLKEIVKSGRAIAFIGAGCSMPEPLKYPSWAGLIGRMLDEIANTKPGFRSTVEMLKISNVQ